MPNADELARQVTIIRDEWGVPHIEGTTDEACVFGFAYAQCEDFFWQVEDTYIASLGRYAEVHGPAARVEGTPGYDMDVLNRAFEIVPSAKSEFTRLEPKLQRIFIAFAMGINHYLSKHPEEKPRLIQTFEPWMVVAYVRHLTLHLAYRYTGLPREYMPKQKEGAWRHVGSNGWAIAGSKTTSGRPILFLNPHQPWYSYGQFYEAHLKSGEGWNFSGACFFGHPLPSIGHNDHLGWTFTFNEPDIADSWRETFDHPTDRLKYRYGDGWRDAVEWRDTVKVKKGSTVETREFTFRKTHHGPCLAKEDDTHYLTARIAKLYESVLARMVLSMVRADNFESFREAMGTLNFQVMNCVYADKKGNIYYLYNGIVPKRDPSFDWDRPVDGANPKTEWQGFHPIEELPQVLNPRTGYVQSCNSSPFTTTDDDNPFLLDFPRYMVKDQHDDKRRAKVSRQLLRAQSGLSLDGVERLAFDTTCYWANNELPVYRRRFAQLEKSNPTLALKAKPYFDFLLDWDGRGGAESQPMTLCYAWYEELYGMGYPAETLKAKYQKDPDQCFQALIDAAENLRKMHGDWRLKWGAIHRIQRHADVADFFQIPFTDRKPSLPLSGAPGPLGVVFTQYYTPSMYVPFVRETRKQYGIVGPSYMGVVEFTDKVRAKSLLPYGASGRANSPHFFDQARLLSQSKMKTQWFYWEDVLAHAKSTYHPGKEVTQGVKAQLD